MNNKKKSVSNLLKRNYGSFNIYDGGKRGRFLHESRTRFYSEIFKNSTCRNKKNYRVFSQTVSKAYSNIISLARSDTHYELYYEDVKVLLSILKKEILQVGKTQAKTQNQIIIPEEIEKELFGGFISFESEIIGKIGGITIPARVDDLIESSSGKLIIRDFKSYEYEEDCDPLNPESKLHRDFMQVCLYGVIYEKNLYKPCDTIQLIYFPNNVISYEFTDEIKEKTVKFALETAFEGYVGVTFQMPDEIDDRPEELIQEVKEEQDEKVLDAKMPSDKEESSDMIIPPKHEKDILGWINTIKGKPLELNRGKDNRVDGYLFPSKAQYVKDGFCVVIEKDDGVRIICIVEKIECFEDNVSGETASHKEENYKIRLIPEGQFTPEGYQELIPQTIISGKIKKSTEREFYQYKNIPQHGTPFGMIEGINQEFSYPLNINLLYQSLFIGGVQGTGKTSTLKYLTIILSQQIDAPALILFDAEEEYGDLIEIPSSEKSVKIMKKNNIKPLNSNKFNIIKIGENSKFCLTLKTLDPLDLPLFLHELTSITYTAIQRVIQDIKNDFNKEEFTFPELKQNILNYIEKKSYSLSYNTKKAIQRALMPIALDLFDRAGSKPIDIISMLEPGKITVINCFDLKDEQQRIIATYFLSALHKNKMKKSNRAYRSGVLFLLDEVQRLLPKTASNSEYQKRIMQLLDEIHHRGRKREYGVIYATQSPMDVPKEILDLCNTKIFFQIQGKGNSYLMDYLPNKDDRERLKKLPVGSAFITSKGKHDPVEIKFPYIN